MTEPYRPSNGDEGMWFMSKFCDRCVKDQPSKPCRILGRTMVYELHEKGYPREWIIDTVGERTGPRCTAFADHVPPTLTLIRDKRQIGLPL